MTKKSILFSPWLLQSPEFLFLRVGSSRVLGLRCSFSFQRKLRVYGLEFRERLRVRG